MTWTNGQGEGDLIMERLDRALYLVFWLGLFPFVQVSSMHFWGSDHRAIHIVLDPGSIDTNVSRKSRHFLFKPLWLKDEGCRDVIRKVWERELASGDAIIFLEKLNKVAGALSKWGRDTFGKLPKKIRAISKEIAYLNKDGNIPESRGRVRALEKE